MRRAASTLFIAVFIGGLACSPQCLAGDPGPTLEELLRSPAAQGITLEQSNSPAFAVADHVRAHAGAEMRSTTKDKDGKKIEHVVHRLLVVSWFLGNGRTVLRYTVINDGHCFDERHVFDWAHQGGRQKSLSKDELVSLGKLFGKLPKSKSTPPIERTVHVSFQLADEWRTETYDASALPDALEQTMLILGERAETRGRHTKKGK